MRTHLLVVDDDDRLRVLLKKYLCEQGFVISTASNANEARQLISLFIFDLMVLDVMMPGETGLELARSLPQDKKPPILILSARGEAEDRIEGLEAGVDDYLAKPFDPKELTLRIHAILRRFPRKAAQKIIFGGFTFDMETGWLTQDSIPVHLTSAETSLLRALAKTPNQPVTREELAAASGIVSERGVDVQMTRLRKKIEPEEGKPLYIQTLRGAGYGLFGSTKGNNA